MIYYTKYAENKFEILNKHKIYFTKEQIEETIKLPNKLSKKGKYTSAQKDGIKVVFNKEGGVVKVITFFPAKQ